ncbi:hypothetical protein BDZ89DRAFT_1059487 [Hymenopellis radicata]|nr:hypothetical protein BDZ89DRAFT_1059487 [Hymenopellis radicata]
MCTTVRTITTCAVTENSYSFPRAYERPCSDRKANPRAPCPNKREVREEKTTKCTTLSHVHLCPEITPRQFW